MMRSLLFTLSLQVHLLLACPVLALLLAHKLGLALIAWVLFSAAVDGMPKPDADSTTLYRWAHASLNLLAGNVFRVFCALSPRFGALLKTTRESPGNDA